ncbi:MAG: hypothetical protein B7Z66_04540 [Chromatiales bacterium 21-64-14]|nr:MAG: hypothetical protein B7Z66_04540 [Chromatiales bacterium 21-64-14]HQU14597.1 SseB family protein [Gammaproteobacteria bacterium]
MDHDEPFEPRNELERALVAAQEGHTPADVFMEDLLGAQVFVPARDSVGIGGFQSNAPPEPLTVRDDEGTEVLVVFTSPDRARAFLEDFPGYHGGLLMDFRAVLAKVGSGFGVALNPGWSVGLEMAPEMVRQLVGADPQAPRH